MMSYDDPLSSEEARTWAIAEMKLSQPTDQGKWKPWFAWHPVKVEKPNHIPYDTWETMSPWRWWQRVERTSAWWGIGRGWKSIYRDPGVWSWWDQNEKERREWEAAGCPH